MGNISMPFDNNGRMEKHERIVCDSCYTCPMIGSRYKCMVRSGYDLCKQCYEIETQNNPFLHFRAATVLSPERLEDMMPYLRIFVKEFHAGKIEVLWNQGF